MKNLKVLICDDSPLVRRQLTKILNNNGIEKIFEASDGEQAVLKYAEIVPDLVFMDIVMPKKTGVEALNNIVSIDKNAKVVMASSVGTQQNLKEAIENGAFDFIQKPVSDDAIVKIINKIKE